MSIPKSIPRPLSLPINVSPEVDNLLNEATGLYIFEPSAKLPDVSGNGNDGTITGATWVGNSLKFITNGTQVVLGSTITTGTTYSLFCLVKPDAVGEDFSTLIAASNGVTGLFYRGAGAQTGKVDYYHGAHQHLTTGTINNLAWNTVGVVGKAAGGTDIYINGNLDSNNADATASTTFLKIGSADPNTAQNLTGNIGFIYVHESNNISASDMYNLHDFAMGLI